MKYRRLDRTELKVSVVGVGTWQFGGEWGRDFSERDVDAIIGAAGDAGVNLIDTAAADLAMVTEEHPQAWGQ